MKNRLEYIKRNLIPLLFWYICFLASMYFVGRYVDDLMDSDHAAELILASKLSGFQLFSTDWYYSTSLRVFDVQLFYRIGLLISPHNWMLAMTVGHTLMFLLLSVTAYFFAKPLVGEKYGILFAAILLCPFSYWYEWHVIRSTAYLPYIILTVAAAGFSIKMLMACLNDDKSIKALWLPCVLSCFLAFVSGLAGIRIALSFYVPFILTFAVVFVYHLRKQTSEQDKENYLKKCLGIMVPQLPMYAAYAAGYVINSSVLSKRYTFKDWNNTSWGDFSLEKLGVSFQCFLGDFGYPVTADWTIERPSMFSLMGILGAFGLCTMILFIVAVIRLCVRFNKLTITQQVVFVLSLVSIVLSCFFITQTQGYPYNGSYYLPVMGFAMMDIILEIYTEDFILKHSRSVLTGFLCVSIAATSFYHVYYSIATPVRSSIYIRDISCHVNEAGYTKGVAEFWESNVITAWSNGEVEMWTVNSLEDLQILDWLQDKSHTSLPEDYFMISAAEDAEHYAEKYGMTVVYENAKFAILE